MRSVSAGKTMRSNSATFVLILALLAQACLVSYVSADKTETTAFFAVSDKNGDGQLSKKEFYEAIMEDKFENLALGHGVSAADLDFEASDLDGDKKVSAEEWDTIFFSQLAEETVENTPAPKPAPAGKPSEASLMTEEEFFHASDLNDDGKLDKKEFYGAIMDQADTFEKLSVIESKKRAAHDMDFATFDTNSDGRVNLREWNAGLFHEKPQKPMFSDGVPFPESSSLVDTSAVVRPMVVDGRVVSPTGAVYYTATDATYREAESYCQSREHQLCGMAALCPDEGTFGPRVGGVHTWVPKEVRVGRWAPLRGHEHVWVELENCGLTRYGETHNHLGLVACCDEQGNPMELDKASAERQQKEAIAKAAAEEKLAEEVWREDEVVGGKDGSVEADGEREVKGADKEADTSEKADKEIADKEKADKEKADKEAKKKDHKQAKKAAKAKKVSAAEGRAAGGEEVTSAKPGEKSETAGKVKGPDKGEGAGLGGAGEPTEEDLRKEMDKLKEARAARKKKDRSGGKKDKKKKKEKNA